MFKENWYMFQGQIFYILRNNTTITLQNVFKNTNNQHNYSFYIKSCAHKILQDQNINKIIMYLKCTNDFSMWSQTFQLL